MPRPVVLLTTALLRFRVLFGRVLRVFGLGEASFLIFLSCLVGLLAAPAAVAFHAVTNAIRDYVFIRRDANFLYGWGFFLLLLIPAAGGLLVGLTRKYIFHFGKAADAGGHGVVDVIESVVRSRRFARPHSAAETTLLAGLTIGTGGSAGAEGPIVQIGGALASGVGKLFSLPPASMALLVASGAAAGISAIFNAPLGGVLFALELILFDFSARSLTPVVVAAVFANVASQSLFPRVLGEHYESLFAIHQISGMNESFLTSLPKAGWIALAGALVGFAGAGLTRGMLAAEPLIHRLKIPEALRPAAGGAAVGLLGILWIVASRLTTGQLKYFDPKVYPLPAFMGDGYGVIRTLIEPVFYAHTHLWAVLLVLAALLLMKTLATILTISSGGVGGIIAPALVMGATGGALVGALAKAAGSDLPPEICALAGMAGGLGAVIHAPLASALILVETAGNYRLLLPGMLAVVTAIAISKLLAPESLYTHALRRRGLNLVSHGPRDLHGRTLRELSLKPAQILPANTPASELMPLTADLSLTLYIILRDEKGQYAGLLTADELEPLFIAPELSAAVTAADLARQAPVLTLDDDLASALEALLRTDSVALVIRSPADFAGILPRSTLLRAIAHPVE